MRYVERGSIPAKRHVQFRDEETGRLLVEEVLGFEGFSGNESILYHLQSPCRIADVGAFTPIEREEWVPETHVHRLTDTAGLGPMGDPVLGRRLLQYNADVEIALCVPEREADYFFRDGEGDEVVFVHEGGGTLETIFGDIPFSRWDYVVIPRGTTYRLGTPRRAAVVVNDPALSASQPADALAASTLNALGHAAEGPCTVRANPVATMAARRAAACLVGGWSSPEPDRDALAFGSLLAGYAIDSAWYGLHHVLSQTLVRLAGAGHGSANAILLPHTLGALAWRFPDQNWALGEAIGEDPSVAAGRICTRTGTTRLADLGIEAERLDRCADAAAERAELHLTPPRAGRAEIRKLYEAAR